MSRSLASPVLAVALALFAGTSFAYLNVIWNPGYYGDFGLAMDSNNPEIVAQVSAGSPAAKAGIRVGDRIKAPRKLHERLLLLGAGGKLPSPGEKLTVTLTDAGTNRAVTLQARTLPALRARDRILLVLKFIWLFAFLAMGLVLVLLRPSKMTWAFYFFAINLVLIIGPNQLPRAPDGWIVAGSIVAHDLIAPAGVAGFLVFCVLFPANAANGWRRTLELLAPYTGAIIAGNLLSGDVTCALFGVYIAAIYGQFATLAAIFLAYLVATVALLKQLGPTAGRERRESAWVCAFLIIGMLATLHDVLLRDFTGPWCFLFVFVLGTMVFLITYAAAHGLERYRIKWVALGFVCASVASIADFLSFGLAPPPWFVSVLELLYVVLPVTVAYAIIRHRVIDIRLVVSRTLTLGIIAALIAFIFAGIDWLFSTRLPSSHLEEAIYAGLALMIGFSLNASRQRFGKTIDFVFFRQWYHAQEQANAITDTIGHAAFKTELYQPLTEAVAQAFSLASTALFERIEDGGFVRVGSCGWPPGMTWHIFPNDPLAVRASKSTRVLDVDALIWYETALPPGVARPTALFPILSAKRVTAILLCGAHENGTALASDELRTIRRFCADAGVVYGKVPASHLGSLTTIEHREAVTV